LNDKRTRSHEILCSAWLDKSVAVMLVACSIYMTVGMIAERRGLPLVLLLARLTIHNGLLLVRKTPKKITLSPLYWLVAISGGYWDLIYAFFRDWKSVSLCAGWFTDGLSLVAALFYLWARLSLGRSFGMVPADRGIKTGGAYRLVRHPIYTAGYVAGLAYVLGHFSTINIVILVSGMAIIAFKAVLEERFLADNETYRSYMATVRYRFLPLVA